MITKHAHPRQTNGRTGEHHGNSATIRLKNALCAKNSRSNLLQTSQQPDFYTTG